MSQSAIQNPLYPLIVILGPTASGKTKLAVELASRIDGEIISADSRQVYRDMDIGTGKDLDDYFVDGRPIPHHLINIADAGERYHVFAWQKDCLKAIEDIRRRRKQPILCGGTGLYIDAVLRGFNYTQVPVDEALRTELDAYGHEKLAEMFRAINSPYHNKADLSTKKRTIRAIEISRWLEENALKPLPNVLPHVIFGLNPSVQERWERIAERLEQRLQNGLINEVENLLQNKLGHADLDYYGLEYKFIGRYLRGNLGYKELVLHLGIAIRQFAKRQMTYFRKMEKHGLHIHWLNAHENYIQQVKHILDKTP